MTDIKGETNELMNHYLSEQSEKVIKKVKWEFNEWIEKMTSECLLIGYDRDGNKYEATRIMGGGEIVEVHSPQMIFDEID